MHPAVGRLHGAWLTAGETIQLRVLLHLFPATDYRHPVVTPATIALGHTASQCLLRDATDLSHGLVTCGLLLDATAGAERVAPEGTNSLQSMSAIPFVLGFSFSWRCCV